MLTFLMHVSSQMLPEEIPAPTLLQQLKGEGKKADRQVSMSNKAIVYFSSQL